MFHYIIIALFSS